MGGGGGRKVDVVLVKFDNSGGDMLGGEVIGIADAWKSPVRCRSTGPLVKSRRNPIQFLKEAVARHKY